MPAIYTKRAYQDAADSDGHRILVDGLWPRGVARDSLRIAAWEKEIAPSPELRRWFDHDPDKWDAFRRAYFEELETNPDPVDRICAHARSGPVTLIHAARDEQYNNAAALKEYLERTLRTR